MEGRAAGGGGRCGRYSACGAVSAALGALLTLALRPAPRNARRCPPSSTDVTADVAALRARVGTLAAELARRPPAPAAPAAAPAATLRPPVLAEDAGRDCEDARRPPLPYLCDAELCKPYAFLIGAQKAGTSALAHIIGANPALVMTTPKEIKFFVDGYDVGYDNRVKGLQWYQQQLPRPVKKSPKKGLREGQIIMDGSATYIAGVRVAEDLSRLFPWARVLVCLRDPVERAWSMWRMKDWYTNAGKGIQNGGQRFLVDLRKEAADYRRCIAELPLPLYGDAGGAYCESRSRNLERGCYAKQLERWMSALGPRRVLVLFADTIEAAPRRALRAVEDFLCVPRVPDGAVPDARLSARLNVGSPGCRGWLKQSNHSGCRAGQGGPPMPAAARDFLTEYYAAPDAALARLLGLGSRAALPWHSVPARAP
eukprot:TRINITY_DN38361_c0_g1_i2.p1 TRINITY_DN38361_c0_g1~~TRINITY_DN38361_c0_g1_i2.p1  ORF type:complete len:426 (+),score=94.53 TRINITY_DN38361_c0_g1_i2:154-1431(+)